MPVIRLGGRLGNQLFQVAFGIAQAGKSQTPLLVDTSQLKPKEREALEWWTGPLIEADSGLVRSLTGSVGFSGRTYRLVQRTLPYRFRSWVLQYSCRFDRRYLMPRRQTCFDGYWQSWRYFASFADRVRAAVKYRGPLDESTKELVEVLRNQNSVSIHVRRGDYVGSDGFPVLSAGFYQTALDLVSTRTPIDRVYVFSDDPAWCRDNLKFSFAFTVMEGRTAGQDLLLMASCRHHVAGMSTFAWWGAWLGEAPGSVVVVPEGWFKSFGEVPPLSDIYPDSWLRVGYQ